MEEVREGDEKEEVNEIWRTMEKCWERERERESFAYIHAYKHTNNIQTTYKQHTNNIQTTYTQHTHNMHTKCTHARTKIERDGRRTVERGANRMTHARLHQNEEGGQWAKATLCME
jgi:hypothetical protein